MATSLIDGEFEKLTARVENLNMSKEEKSNFVGISGIAFVRKRRKKNWQAMKNKKKFSQQTKTKFLEIIFHEHLTNKLYMDFALQKSCVSYCNTKNFKTL